ncbi:DUF6355 family natural product biosynthesis protein [Streptomyces sp. NBC_00140]|uniref:DUF6355 family natural product biosynthesis protein n=1 Tax=Streptomyces sp. NBC_00140 TaxID=2975664 RepID=UPI0022527253|nr:DUF6355 family natural product biosynthesis protein [Streptomyces sp. NBC_00140]MCX5328444.1 DUF6355 family natural product biosynthesis protein [Streptomyces sp. NBC_00140]
MLKNTSKLRLVAAAFSAALLAGTALSGSAHAAPEGNVSAQGCGYYEAGDFAYYGHCGRGSAIIEIDWDSTWDESYWCVAPGEARLGKAEDVDFAHYVGDC